MQTLSLSQIADTVSDSSLIKYGDDFFIMDVAYKAGDTTQLIYPIRFDGIICLYCMAGAFELSIGLEQYPVRRDCFIVSLPGDIITFSKVDDGQSAKVRIMAMSDHILDQMEFDRTNAEIIFRYRMVKANPQYKVFIHHYRNLFRSVIYAQHADTDKSLGYLLRSMNIEIARVWERLLNAPGRDNLRGSTMVDNFVSLVSKHHLKERSLEFYAGAMSLTPKYLSAAVKKASGKSAVEWITSYVILEAKYYLKHTSLPVKEIAYALSFINQMDFYRYFLRHTGVTPSQYRNNG